MTTPPALRAVTTAAGRYMDKALAEGQARVARDDAIRAARAEGHTLTAIGQAAGLSHEMIRRICEEEK